MYRTKFLQAIFASFSKGCFLDTAGKLLCVGKAMRKDFLHHTHVAHIEFYLVVS